MFGFGYGRGFSLGRVSSAADSYKGILDLYPGAVAGYSVFKLTKTATNSIRVRRTFDDTEQDIGFDSNGNLDTTSLLNFVNVNNPIDSGGIETPTAAYSLRKATSVDPVTTLPGDQAQAAAAYSLRKVKSDYDGSAIRVRRSSDDTEQDIGFDSNGDLDTTALTTFVNADVNQYTSDFSSTEDLSEALGTGAAAQSVEGVDDAYKFTLSGGSGLHQAFRNSGLSGGGTATLSLDYYIPSTNTAVDGIQVGIIGGTTQVQSTTDAWTSVSLSVTDFGNGNTFFRAKDGGSSTIDADGDVFYLKNIVVTQTTADGAVTTWYDQSGNNNHATNSTESEQPLVVSGGSVVTEGGKAAIDFDGTDDEFVLSNVSARSFYVVLSSVDGGDFVSTTQNRVVFNTSTFDWQEKNFSTSISYTLGNQALLSFNDSTSGIFTLNGVTHTNTDANPYNQGSAVFNRIGANDGGSPLIEGTIQEFILFNSDQSSNRTDIEWEINNYYSIFDNWDRESAIRVRRSSDDTEQDIGFDANGDLDTTALLAFVGGENRFEDSDPSSGDFATLLNGSTSTNDWGLSSHSFTNKTTLDRDLGNALAYPRFDKVETGETYTMSAYVKVVDGNSATFGSSSGQQGYFNLRGAAAGSPSDYTVTNVTGDIYRISATLVAGSSSGSGFLRWSNANAGKIEITGFQIVKGSTITDYVETSGGVSGFGFVTTWYDQSGNNNHATNATESEQPLIVDGGTLVEEDGKAAIQFDGVDDMLQKDIDPDIAQPLTLFHVRRYRSNGTYCAISYDNTTGTGYADINVANDFRSYYGSYLGTTTQNTNKGLWYSLANGTSSEVGLDGATAETGNAGTQGLEVLTIGSAFGAFDAPINTQEIIIFNSDQSSTREDIEKNIGAYYGLAGYGDGAVTTWYDQSGNNNHATNSNESEQPLIVDGGSMAQFDGINAIEFNGTSHELAASLNLSTTTFSSFNVAGTDGTAGTSAQAIFGSNGTAFYSQIRSYDLETRISSSPVLTLDDDIGNNPNQMQLFTSINGTSQGNQYIDGTIGNRSPLDTSTSGGINETTVYIGSANGQRYLGGGICEIILFASDQSSNRTGIEENINSRFNIY